MRNNLNIPGGRQTHTTPNGLYLERKYVYLVPSLWDSLNQISKASGMSASQYLAFILSEAADGQSIKGTNPCQHSH